MKHARSQKAPERPPDAQQEPYWAEQVYGIWYARTESAAVAPFDGKASAERAAKRLWEKGR